MGYLDDIESGYMRLMESRRLFLRELKPAPADPPDQVVILMCWDDGYDDSGLPVGKVLRTRYRRGLMGRTVEYWTAHAIKDARRSYLGMPEVATGLPDINEAVGAVLVHLSFHYS